jgi:hypothetical protein
MPIYFSTNWSPKNAGTIHFMFKGLFEWFEGHKNVLKMASATLLPNNIMSYIYTVRF